MKTAHIFLLAAAAFTAWMLYQSGSLPGVSNPVSTDPRGGTGGGSDPGGSGKGGGIEIFPISTDFDDVVMSGGGGSAGDSSGLPEFQRRR